MSYTYKEKQPGGLIPSSEWNAMGKELMRLSTAKLGKTGGTIKGDVNAGGSLTAGSLTVNEGATFGGAVTVAKAVTAQSLSVTGTTTLTKDAETKGKLTAKSLKAEKSVSGNSLTIKGNHSFKGGRTAQRLTVTQTTTLIKKASIGSDSARANLTLIGGLRFQPFPKLAQANKDLFAVAALRETRSLFGRIKADGGVDVGDGFTVQRLASGRYRITFAHPFSDEPLVMVTAAAAENNFNHAAPVAITTAQFDLLMMTTNHHWAYGTAHETLDAAFHFVVIGW